MTNMSRRLYFPCDAIFHRFCFGSPETTMPSTKPSTSGKAKEPTEEPTYESLEKLTMPELKRLCEEANLKTARSSKDTLIKRLLDPVTNNKDNLPNRDVLNTRFSVDALRDMCEMKNLPKDGSKAKLLARLIDPAAHQKWGMIPGGRGGGSRGRGGGSRGRRGGRGRGGGKRGS